MTKRAVNILKILRANCVVVAMFFCTLTPRAAAPDLGRESDVEFRIATDKLVYSPKSTVHLKFLVTNTSEVPLYLFREVSPCSSQLGSYLMLILDRSHREVPIQRCSADLLMDTLDVVGTLTNPRFGILLLRGEVYGRDWTFELPDAKGTYRLKAELIPPGFTEGQKELLADRKMRVLQTRYPAPIVTITIR
jgi:hypothetical protein